MGEKAVMKAYVTLEVGEELIFDAPATQYTTEDQQWGKFCDARRRQTVTILEIRLHDGWATAVKVRFPDGHKPSGWSGLHNFTVPERVPATA